MILLRTNWFVALIVFLFSCQFISKEHIGDDEIDELNAQLPKGFPAISVEEENTYSLDRWKLGKKLFFEKRFSKDGKLSCASCHKPEFAFSDNKALSIGAFKALGTRNAPSLANVAYHPYFLREGSIPTLEMQVLVPIQEENEFNHNIVLIAKELKEDERYQALSEKAYGREMDPYVITRALGVFQRTLISGNSDFDKYKFQSDSSALSDKAKAGMKLFYSEKTNCSSCHSDFNFTNYSLENNGLYEVYADSGRFRFSHDSADIALFKVPSLRNVAITAPYMHDGSLSTLEEVIEHYNSGGRQHPNKSEKIKALNLSQEEMESLIAFLESLTDKEFTNDPRWVETDI
ncbi:MAG: cytochrome-c peroxidase [Flavobacteriales bacterium]|nr:cytochrome-c peroxidase [Flavobacteriales bacterium]